jgi:nucleoside-specific outer membrane channel protein Tsx
LLGRDFSFGPIKDVLLATTYELGEGDVESYLVRPEFDLAAPGFDFFQLNFYYRKLDGDRVPNGALQVTPAWSYTNPVGNSSLLIDGFIDWLVQQRASARWRSKRLPRQLPLQPTDQI